MNPTIAAPRKAHPLETLLSLMKRARQAESATALRFVAINDCHLLAPFEQGVLWRRDRGVQALSGILEVESNTPYVQWLNKLFGHLSAVDAGMARRSDVPAEIGADWPQWLPEHVVWLPFSRTEGESAAPGGLLFARALPWLPAEVALLGEWSEHCGSLLQLREKRRISGRAFRWLTGGRGRRSARLWLLVCAMIIAAAYPVRLSVLAPGELAPLDPIVVRAPFDGVLERFLVESNQPVEEGQPLYVYEQSVLESRLQVAQEARRAAEAELRQVSQQAFSDPRARASLATARSRVEESRLEAEYLESQLARSVVTASRAGVAFIDDPSAWSGRALSAGQGVLRIAAPERMEIEAWLPVGDAIRLEIGAPVKLYLSSSPLDPVDGAIRYISYEAQERPDGSYAYRVRANIVEEHAHRLGLRGTARLSGDRAPLVYWVLRRPLAAARSWLGF